MHASRHGRSCLLRPSPAGTPAVPRRWTASRQAGPQPILYTSCNCACSAPPAPTCWRQAHSAAGTKPAGTSQLPASCRLAASASSPRQPVAVDEGQLQGAGIHSGLKVPLVQQPEVGPCLRNGQNVAAGPGVQAAGGGRGQVSKRAGTRHAGTSGCVEAASADQTIDWVQIGKGDRRGGHWVQQILASRQSAAEPRTRMPAPRLLMPPQHCSSTCSRSPAPHPAHSLLFCLQLHTPHHARPARSNPAPHHARPLTHRCFTSSCTSTTT